VKRHGRLIIICVAVYLTAAVPQALAAQAADPALKGQADVFCVHAAAYLSAGSLEGARAMTASALEIYPGYSEALFLRARIELASRAETRAAIRDLQAALAAGTWGATDPADAEQALAGVLLRTNAFAEARAMAERLERLRPDDPSNLLLLIRAEAGGGNQSDALKHLDDALVRFPLVDEFRLLSASLLERLGRRAAARETISTGLKVHPDGLPLILAGARLEADARRKAAAIAQYLAKGGKDPFAAVIALEAATKTDDKGKNLELFLTLDGLAREDLISRVVAAVKGSAGPSAALSKAMTGYGGVRDLDADEDGFWEERWTFSAGKATGWVREPAEDGVPRNSATFIDGTPVTFTYSTRQGTQVTLRFSRYPYIESAATAAQGTLRLVPYTMQCAFLAGTKDAAEGAAPRIRASIPTPTMEMLTSGADRQTEYTADGSTPKRSRELARGKVVSMEEDADGDGVIDHRVWYAEGEPVRGERSLAVNGVFPVKETWRGGVLAADAIDTDGNGLIDFRQTYGPQPSRSWDYNEDGTDDCREHVESGGTVREMSTALDGVFDLKVLFTGGRIVSVTRDGTAVPVTADARQGITWIGQRASQAPDVSLPDGIQAIDGRQYLLFRYEGIVYAEAVR
jgi:tetratricopeptide (TPR) repeat protein